MPSRKDPDPAAPDVPVARPADPFPEEGETAPPPDPAALPDGPVATGTVEGDTTDLPPGTRRVPIPGPLPGRPAPPGTTYHPPPGVDPDQPIAAS